MTKGTGADYVTDYTYSVLNQMLTVSMTRPGLAPNPSTVTQTRTWVSDANQRLQSVSNPENGTTTYYYNGDGTLEHKIDAKGQKVSYVYDSMQRMTEIHRYPNGTTEDTCQASKLYFDSKPFDSTFSQNIAGRLAANEQGCQGFKEMFSYATYGAPLKKRLRVGLGSNTIDKDLTYTYNGEGKPLSATYPGWTIPFTYQYDLMGRPSKLTGVSSYNGSTIDWANNVTYNAASQVSGMSWLRSVDNNSGSAYYLSESRSYNTLNQLTRQTATAGATTIADIGYVFSATQNNGQITDRINYVSGEDVQYQYDSLNRLTSAAVSGTGGWGQSFTMDGFGNLWTQTVTKGSAPAMSLTVAMATNRVSSTGWSYDSNGNTTQMPAQGGGGMVMTFDVENRMSSNANPSGTEYYSYGTNNKRFWKKDTTEQSTSTYTESTGGACSLIR